MSKHRSKRTRRNAQPKKRKLVKRAPKPLTAKPLPVADEVEEASKESFPCSDPPGYGHA